MSQRLPDHLVRLMDARLLTRGQAGAVNGYLGDVQTCMEAEARQGKLRTDSNAEKFWREGSDKARQRVKAAQAKMGDSGTAIIHMVGRRGLSLAEAAADLGRDPDDVRIRLSWACDDLLKIYSEWAAVA
jgi:DNA-directed RNA polymerase specialized sigma24 family protein